MVTAQIAVLGRIPEVGLSLLREAGLPAVVSGAGPSILVLASDPSQRLIAAELVAQHAETPWQALMLAVDVKGTVLSVS